ncbi:uncharacterized protein ACLA_028510 [Aspergillus clavatus NRRL 1]|uniref:TeaA receptor TeaR n=1 Tax=Aspergillus clavatus (strain ATCC 1007 / CBS 513.65 / DSM 816 / NCTC 3887 / NRRL 1 / QM 1276 / 107) TaxID=344612 RepID=A1CR55_ASPCL|nr:uncharacterized protein ACLA_028510 [Aspergillus clavatus NRRL 1]EAW08126.1 conserved hypothetical protein [Aspergillus clavatus NRRL 1]
MAGAATAAFSADIWSSSAVDANQQEWEFAVPVRQGSTNRRPQSRSRDSAHRRSRDYHSKGSRSSSMSRQAYADDGHYSSRGRREHSLSRHGSGAGNLRDTNGYEAANRGGGNLRDSTDTHHSSGPYKGSEKKKKKDGAGLHLDELDSANWIHRDKLARIESEELQQAAYLFQRRPGRARTHDSHNSGLSGSTSAPATTEPLEPWPNVHDGQRGFAASPSPMDGDDIEEDEGDDERRHWDLRRPEEIAARDQMDSASSMYRNPGLRKSSSRIPIPTASPAPLSPEHLGREFPAARARGLTNGDEDGMSFGKPRRASEPMPVDSTDSSAAPSMGSRPNSRGIQTLQNSPAKKNPPGKGAAATNRKTSAPTANSRKVTGPRNRTVSTNSQRPTTRSGDARVPNPINRPEGDPPWLATMYKPDPRLPPDQQILPTHARRMQQEQWEKEGKTPVTYDREFAPLAISPDDQPPAVRKEAEPEKVEEEIEKPPPSPRTEKPEPLLTSPRNPESTTRPNSSTGYSPMPRLQEMPSASQVGLTPKWNPPVVTAQAPPPKEKGCGCCVVM